MVAVLSTAFLSAFLGACGETTDTPTHADDTAPKKKMVKVSRVRAVPPVGSVEYVGVLTAQRRVRVSTELGGTIERLHFEKGDRVSKGDLLAEIGTSSIGLQVQQAAASLAAARSQLEKLEHGTRPEEIRMAEALLQEADAALVEATNQFERIKDLHSRRAVSNSDYDAAKRQLDMAEAQKQSAAEKLALAEEGPRVEDINAARANLKGAEAALALQKDRLRKSRLLAPCDGIIAFREIEEGEVVAPGIMITRIIDLDRLKIKVSVGEKDIHILHKQNRFPFTVDALPEQAFSCRLFFQSPTADPATRSFPVELMVDDPDPRMADGMTARVRLPLVDEKKNLKIPSAWLSEEEGKMGLYVAREGKAFFKEVELGAYYDQRVEILSGLAEEELVITNPAGIRSGDAVEY